MPRAPFHEFFLYCIGGSLGFIMDAGIVYLFKAYSVNPFLARIISITVALTGTWVYHRTVTFQPSGRRILSELGRYYVSNALGAIFNYIVYSAWLLIFTPKNLLPALAVASIAALAVNYGMARYFVFSTIKKFWQSNTPT